MEVTSSRKESRLSAILSICLDECEAKFEIASTPLAIRLPVLHKKPEAAITAAAPSTIAIWLNLAPWRRLGRYRRVSVKSRDETRRHYGSLLDRRGYVR